MFPVSDLLLDSYRNASPDALPAVLEFAYRSTGEELKSFLVSRYRGRTEALVLVRNETYVRAFLPAARARLRAWADLWPLLCREARSLASRAVRDGRLEWTSLGESEVGEQFAGDADDVAREAGELLICAHGERLRKFLGRKFALKGPDLDDATQAAFVRAFEMRRRYDPARGAWLTWLQTLAANAELHRRARHDQCRVLLDGEAADRALELVRRRPHGASATDVARLHAAYREVAGQADPTDLDVFADYVFSPGEPSRREVGATYGLTEQEVRTREGRIARLLRSVLRIPEPPRRARRRARAGGHDVE